MGAGFRRVRHREAVRMTRKPLSPEATEALHNVMRKACERMERGMKDEQSKRLAEQLVRLCDEMGHNV